MTLRFYSVLPLLLALLVTSAGPVQAQKGKSATKHDTSPALRTVDPSDVPSDAERPYPVKVVSVPPVE